VSAPADPINPQEIFPSRQFLPGDFCRGTPDSRGLSFYPIAILAAPSGDSMDNNLNRGILIETGTNEVEFLEFSIADQLFAVNVAKLRQTVVFKDHTFTKLPKKHPSIPGVVQYRNQSVQVVDLRNFLGIQTPPADPERLLLLFMEFNGHVNGFLVDAVAGIHRVSWKQFVPLELSAWHTGKTSAIGTITVQDRVIMILDMEAMMADLDPSMRIKIDPTKELTSVSEQIGKQRIVYAEDSLIIQKIAVKALHDAGFEAVETFPSGKQALEYVAKSAPGEISLILSDIEMPEMDGLSFCKQLRENKATSTIPFVFFSSIITEEMKRKCAAVGANGSYSKPELNQVIAAINELLAPAK